MDAATSTSHFTGGSVRRYMGTGANKDFSTFNPGSSPAADLAEATNGTLWLTLTGHALDAAGTTFRGKQTNVGSPVFTGNGDGLLDIDTSGSGSANAFFDSNGAPGGADFYVGFVVNRRRRL